MSEPLSDTEIAELRRLYGAHGAATPADFDSAWKLFVAMRDALPGLLDEVKRAREVRRALGLGRWPPPYDDLRPEELLALTRNVLRLLLKPTS